MSARTRAVAAWCLFDFANSSYTTVIITVAFSVYFQEVAVNAADNTGDRWWGLANFVAMLVVALSSPVLGALSDYSGRRKMLLIATTLLAVAATALMATTGPGGLAWAMLLYVLGTIGFESGYVFYNAFLPEVSTPATIGRISGWAWGIGFVGGLLALLLCFPLLATDLRDASGRLVASAIDDRRLAFLLVAVFFLLFSLPAFLWLRESKPLGRPRSLPDYFVMGLRRVRETLGGLRQHRETGKFVLSSLFVNDGISTIIAFSAIYAIKTLKFTSAEVTLMFVLLNVVAFPGAVLAGYLADAFGPKRTLTGSLVLWIVVVITAFAATSKAAFWVAAMGAALGMGSTQAVARSFMAQLSPPEREAEFFGFFVLSGKLASTIGPLLFGTVSAATGSQRLAVLSLLPFFLVGLGLLLWVNPAAGPRRASP